MRDIPLFVVDAFTQDAFSGNPAAVVPDARGLTMGERMAIAEEIGVPTTAFLSEQGGEIDLKLLTPTREIEMCGHAVIAATTVLDRRGPVNYSTGAGPVIARLEAGEVTMTLSPPRFLELDVDRIAVADHLGIRPPRIAESPPLGGASTGLRHLFVPVVGVRTLEQLRPDFARLASFCHELGVDTVGVYSLATDDDAVDFQLRDLSVAIGKNEEPASGTTNSALVSWLWRHGVLEPERGVLTAVGLQGVELGRGSRIATRLEISGAVTRVEVRGTARIMMSGTLHLPESEAARE